MSELMSQSSNVPRNGTETQRFTTTATIECAAYPAHNTSSAVTSNRWKPSTSETTRKYSPSGASWKSISSSSGSSSNASSTATSPTPFEATKNVFNGSRFGANKSPVINGTSKRFLPNCSGSTPPPPPPMPPSSNSKTINGHSKLNNSVTKPQLNSKPNFGNTNSLPRGYNLNSIKTNGLAKGFPSNKTNNQSINSNQSNTLKPLRRVESEDISGKAKVDPNDPQVRKLVYNMYRGMLDKKHDHSNTIIGNLPNLQVDLDEGVKARVLSMMKQQEDLKPGKSGSMNGPSGPPPPPPPPPFIVPGMTPPTMPESVAPICRPAPRAMAPQMGPQVPLPPAALAGAMMKDKKPFTYTPGGLDLSEIRSPRMQKRLTRNAALEGSKMSPLAQRNNPNSPSSGGSSSPSIASGMAVQVLPMPGMAMSKSNTPSSPPAQSSKKPPQPKEAPVIKSVCGPPPPPPPFQIGVATVNNKQTVKSIESTVLTPPILTQVQPSMINESTLNTPSSPPFSSPASDPRSPSLSIVSTTSSTNGSGANSIPAPPPPPVQAPAPRRGSIVSRLSTQSTLKMDRSPLQQATLVCKNRNKNSEDENSKEENCETNTSGNASPHSLVDTDRSRSRDSSSMAVEDFSASYRDSSMTSSMVSNAGTDMSGKIIEKVTNGINQNNLSVNSNDHITEDQQYSSNESLLKQISSIEKITAKHQLKQETSQQILSEQPSLKFPVTGYDTENNEQIRLQQEKEQRLLMQEEQLKRQQEELMYQQEKLLQQKEQLRKEQEQQRLQKEQDQIRINEQKMQEEQENQRRIQIEQEVQKRLKEEYEVQMKLQEEQLRLEAEQEEKNRIEQEEHDRNEEKRRIQEQQMQMQREQEMQRRMHEEQEMQSQLREEQEMQRRLHEEQQIQRRMHEEQEIQRRMQEEQEIQRRMQEEQEIQRRMQEEQEMQRRMQEEQEQQQQRRIQEEKEQQRRIQEEKEQQRRIQEEQEQKRLFQEEQDRQRKLQIEKERQIKVNDEQKEMQLHEQKEQQRLQLEQQQINQLQIDQEQQRLWQQEQYNSQQQTRLVRQGSVPVQPNQTSPNIYSQGQINNNGSPNGQVANVSPTSGLNKAPLPWMSSVPRRETSAPPEFVNYAQVAQARLQHQRSLRQQSHDTSRNTSAPSPIFKEAVVVSPPVIFHHPGSEEIGNQNSGNNTLPRKVKVGANSAAANRPWVAKHLQYQQKPPQQQTRSQQPPQKWPEVQPPNCLRQQSISNESSNQRHQQVTAVSETSHVRIIPIMVEQDSSSDAEQSNVSMTSSMMRNTQVQKSNNTFSNQSHKTPPLNYASSPGTSPVILPPVPQYNKQPMQKPQTPPIQQQSFNLQQQQQQQQHQQQQQIYQQAQYAQSQQQHQPAFKVVQRQSIPAAAQGPQSTAGAYNNTPVGLYSDGNAVEALQQMQQSLAQLNSGLQNAYPKFIQDKMSTNLPTRSMSSPGPCGNGAVASDAAPMQSRSFRILQNVVDSEASEPHGSPQLPKVVPQQPQQSRLAGNNAGIPSRAFRALQQHTDRDVAGPGESDL